MEEGGVEISERIKRVRRPKVRMGEDFPERMVEQRKIYEANVPSSKKRKVVSKEKDIDLKEESISHSITSQKLNVVKVEVEDDHQLDKGISIVPEATFQNGSSGQSSENYYILEREVHPVNQHYINMEQYNSNAEEKSEGEAIGMLTSTGMVQRCNSEVPIMKKDAGPYDFSIELDEKEDTNKTPSWLMNSKNKLYTNINKAVPFHVKLGEWPRDERDFQIRVTAVFSSHQYARAHVKRCPIHATPQHQTNIDFPFPEHVVRVDHPGAHYETSNCGRLSVVVPLEQPQAGPLGNTMPLLLRFMCLCSCSGGINRRPLAVIFTLEKHNGAMQHISLSLFGRQTVDVRVCACPMRDYRNEEGNVPNKDRRCGRKRGGRVAANNFHTQPNSERNNSVMVQPKQDIGDDQM